jgi:beta-fructofuranosidase
VEKRQGDQTTNVVLAGNSLRELVLERSSTQSAPSTRTLVEAGALKTIFAAEEPWCVNDHTLIQGADKTWHLFGITHPKPLDFFKDPGRRLAHAIATSLTQSPRQAQPPAITADWGRYQEYLLWAPHVVRHQGIYYMFVCAGDKGTHRYRLHLLTSADLKDWKRSPANPLLSDGFDGRDPMVMQVDDGWVLYYTATTTPEGGNHIVACVTSKDLIHWNDRKVVFVHPQVGTFAGPTESPFVVRRGANFYLFVCDNDWTDVYLSDNPYSWDFAQKAGRIHTHASEIVRDTNGKWFITHAGWMNGPISLAPLQWHDALDNAPTSLAPATE